MKISKMLRTESTICRDGHSMTAILCWIATILCLCICTTSCSNEEPPSYSISVDTYIITFSGDRNKFKGLVSVSTTSTGCYLSSSSFNNNTKNSFSDSKFSESYELTLKSYNNSHPKVKIQCTALCFSDDNLVMTINIYKMSSDGGILLHEDFAFKSFPVGSKPSYEDYSYIIEL